MPNRAGCANRCACWSRAIDELSPQSRYATDTASQWSCGAAQFVQVANAWLQVNARVGPSHSVLQPAYGPHAQHPRVTKPRLGVIAEDFERTRAIKARTGSRVLPSLERDTDAPCLGRNRHVRRSAAATARRPQTPAAPASPRRARRVAQNARGRTSARLPATNAAARRRTAPTHTKGHVRRMSQVRAAWDDALYAKRKPEIISEVDGKFCCLVEWVEQPLPADGEGHPRHDPQGRS